MKGSAGTPDCARYEAALREHALGGPLDVAAARHLAACERCQAVLAAERRLLSDIDGALAGVGRAEPSAAFARRAATQALAARADTRPRFLFDRFAWRAAAVVGAAGLALVLLRPIASHPPPTAAPPSASPTGPSLASPGPAPAASPVAAARARGQAPTATTWAPRQEPLVLVPPGQEAAIVRFAALVTSGAVEPPRFLVESPDPTRDLPGIAELTVQPLAIAQIPREGADDEGEMP